MEGCNNNVVEDGIGILAILVHPATDNDDCYQSSSLCKEDKKYNTCALCTNNILLVIDNIVIQSSKSARLARGSEYKCVNLQ